MTDGIGWRDYRDDYEPPRSMAGPWFLAILVQVAVLGVMRLQMDGFHGDRAYFLGQVAGASLPVPLILWFAAMRRRDPRGWWKLPLVFLPLTFVLMFGRATPRPDRDAELRRATNSIAAAGEQMLEKGPDLGPLRRSGATGEAGEVERITLGFMEQIAADSRAYERELAATGLHTLMTGPLLSTRSGLPAARNMLAAARALVEHYERLLASRYAALPGQIEAADLSPATKAEVRDGFARNLMRAQDYWRRTWRNERAVLDGLAAQVGILERSRWTRRGQLFEFPADADRIAFNRQADAMDRLTAERDAMDAAQQSRARDTIARLRSGGR